MPRDERRRQRALERKAVKRKEKRAGRQPAVSVRQLPRSVGQWPVEECLISRDWQREGTLVQIVVARQGTAGDLAVGVFLVDLACLGVKDALARLVLSWADYDHLRRDLGARQPLVRTDLNTAAKVVREGIAYARRWGFEPHPDYAAAASLLEGADPDASAAQVPLGREGKPFFIAGPRDNVPRIIDQLMKTAGPGNFDFLAPFEVVPFAVEQGDEASKE